jgi:dipeptidyl aminopeptidase/acylaminoacyl peptidase
MRTLIIALGLVAALALSASATAAAAPARSGPLVTMSYVLKGVPPHADMAGAIVFISPSGSVERTVSTRRFGTAIASPDGRRIAYQDGLRLWTADLHHHHRHLIVRSRPGKYAGTPVWSRDGHRLALTIGTRLVIVGADGAGMRTISRLRPDGLVWAPDGQSIAFLHPPLAKRAAAGCKRFIDDVILTVSTRGGPVHELYRPPFHCGVVVSFDWAPDGRRLLVLVADASDRNTPPDPRAAGMVGLDVTALHGHAFRRIATDRSPFSLRWSPDGRDVAFLSWECPAEPLFPLGPGLPRVCLHVAHADRGVARTVARIRNDGGLYMPLEWVRR